MDGYLMYVGIGLGGLVLGLALGFWLGIRKARSGEDIREERRRLLRGAYQIIEENWTEATKEFGEAARQHPESVDVYFVLGRLFRRIGQTDRAIYLHRSILNRHELVDDSTMHKATFELAEDLVAAGRVEEAIEQFEQLIAQAPRWAEPLQRLIDLSIRARNWKVAAKYLPRLGAGNRSQQNPLIARVFAQRALQLIDSGRHDAAKPLLVTAKKQQADCVQVSFAMARYQAARGKTKAAVKELKQAMGQSPQAAPILLAELRQLCENIDKIDIFDDYLFQLLDDDELCRQHARIQQAIRYQQQGEDLPAREIVTELVSDGWLNPDICELAALLHIDLSSRLKDEAVCDSWICSQCGHSSNKLDWYCSTCGSWETYFPTKRIGENKS